MQTNLHTKQRTKTMRIISLILTAAIILSCSENSKNNMNKDKMSTKPKEELKPKKQSEKILVENSLEHIFSDTIQKDKFEIVLIGNSIIDGTVIFTIKNSNNAKILKEEFASTFLLGYAIDYNASINEKEKFIKNRIKNFFNEENFDTPAINKGDEFNENFSDLEIWNDIKNDSTSVGYYYLIGEEDGRKISFSKKNKKVVMYFNCC
jgi:hypothetical protein